MNEQYFPGGESENKIFGPALDRCEALSGKAAHKFRRFLFGKKVPDELLARALFWNLIGPIISLHIEQEDPSSNVQESKKRRVVETFSLAEIKNIFGEIKKMAEKNTMPFLLLLEIRLFLIQKLSEKGVTIPSQREQLSGGGSKSYIGW